MSTTHTAATATRILCEDCHRMITLDGNGAVRKHKVSRDFGVCRGSGKLVEN